MVIVRPAPFAPAFPVRLVVNIHQPVLAVTAIMLVLAAAMVMLAVIVVVMSVTIVVLAAARLTARRWRTAATWVAGGRLIERWHGKSMLALWRGRCRTANGQAL